MKIDVLDVKIDALTKTVVLDIIQKRLDANQSTFIVTPYSESIVAAQKDTEFRNVLNSADLALADGIGILWAAKFLSNFSPLKRGRLRGGKILYELIISLLAIIFKPSYIRDPIPEKISGSEFIWDLAELAAKNNYSVFLLGGFGDTAERAGERLREKFPNLKIAGTASPPLLARGGDGGGVDADFLFVALGPITQEKWIYQNLPNLRVKLAIGLGGTFDYLAQKRPYRPQIWALRGLEWLWRLLTQPRRVVRIFKGVLGLIWYSYRAKMDN